MIKAKIWVGSENYEIWFFAFDRYDKSYLLPEYDTTSSSTHLAPQYILLCTQNSRWIAALRGEELVTRTKYFRIDDYFSLLFPYNIGIHIMPFEQKSYEETAVDTIF